MLMVTESKALQQVHETPEVSQSYEAFCRGLGNKLAHALTANKTFQEYTAMKATGLSDSNEDWVLLCLARGYPKGAAVTFPYKGSLWLYVREKTPVIERQFLSRRNPFTNSVTALEIMGPIDDGRVRDDKEPPIADISVYKVEFGTTNKIFGSEAEDEVRITFNILSS